MRCAEGRAEDRDEVPGEATTGQDSDVDEAALRDLLDDVRSGIVDPDDAVAILRRLPFADLGFARVDHHRAIRSGLPEAVYGPGKTAEHCVAIVGELLDAGTRPVLLTRVDEAQSAAVLAAHPSGRRAGNTIVWNPLDADRPERVLVVTAGTSDLPVADECAAVLDAHGDRPRLASPTSASPACIGCSCTPTSSAGADVVVVVAGMEGALASLVGGLTPAPVIAVPTSVGYGAGFEGVTALLGDARVVRRGRHRRRHRQRVRRGVRRTATVHGARPIAIDAHVTNVAWFHCFSGIAGDMALGQPRRRGRRPRRGARALQPHPRRWLEARGRSGACAAASARRRSSCTPRRAASCARRGTSPG